MKPCYVFGPWTDRAPEDPIRAVREAPNPAERAEVWLYTKEDDGTPVSNDVAGWYGCFGAMTDSIKLAHQDAGLEDAKRLLDARIGVAGHTFAEYLQAVQERADRNEKRVAELELRLAEEEHGSSQLIDQRDRAEDMADKLAEHLAAGRDIGEHSSDNNPWQNALDLPDLVPTPPATSTSVRRATDADTPVGDDRAPDRYMASGRETIDEARDVCMHLAGYGNEKLADALFAVHCLLTAYVYRSRAGKKGPAKEDHAKAGWYVQMVRHVIGSIMDRMEPGSRKRMIEMSGRNYDDPRASRPIHQPYDGVTATLPPAGLEKLFNKALVPLELDILASAFGSRGYLYQTPEKGKGRHGFSRIEVTIGGRGSTTFTPTSDEIEAVLPKKPDARAIVGGFSVRRCSCGRVIVGGFSCPACGCGP